MTRALLPVALLALGVGCEHGSWIDTSAGGSTTTPPEETGLPPDTEDTEDTAPPDTEDTEDTVDTEETDTEETGETEETEPPVECDVPPTAGDVVRINFSDDGEEFAFDLDGYLVTRSDDLEAIVRTAYDGERIIVAPFSSWEVAGVDIMVGGDLVVADEGGGSLRRVTMEGAQSTLAGSLWNPNSVIVHRNGDVFSTSYDEIYRVDPDTGAKTFLVRHPNRDLDGLAFTSDYLTLYYNEDSTGVVHKATLDKDGEWLGEVTFANLSGGGGELDGMTVDECGNLYVSRTNGTVYLVTPDGTSSLFVDLGPWGGSYVSAVHFGLGIGGWEADHLYAMDRYGKLFDIEVGLRGAGEAHE